MDARVLPEEAAALRGPADGEPRAAEPTQVVERDFRTPLRFSAAHKVALANELGNALEKLDAALSALFKRPVSARVEELREVSADSVHDELAPPFALASFDVAVAGAAQPGWIRWEIRAAVAAIEMLLGSEGSAEPRELSPIERPLLARIFGAAVDETCRALGLKASGLAIARSLEDVPSWRDGGKGADPHRACIALALEGLAEPSRLLVYLPGVGANAATPPATANARPATNAAPSAPALPEHLRRVHVELSAHLGASDVPLEELLALEVGDVIPLGTSLADPLVLRVENRPCGTATMGSLRGLRAIKVVEVNARLEEQF